MKNILYITLIILAAFTDASASSISLALKGGYAPEVGGAMYSGWQGENLGVYDGINDINRSQSGMSVTTIEAPVGVVAGAEARYAGESLYLKSGIDIVYSFSGGKGSTLNSAGTEVVDVTYSQWFFYVPVTAGIVLNFWDESSIFAGGGAAFAYGTYSNSFKSVSLEHEGSFAGYGVPLVAELGCEYILTDHAALCCSITYLYGKSNIIEDGTDFARIDFTCYSFTAGVVFYYDI